MAGAAKIVLQRGGHVLNLFFEPEVREMEVCTPTFYAQGNFCTQFGTGSVAPE